MGYPQLVTHIDSEKDPFLKSDVNIDKGVSDANFLDNFKLWFRMMKDIEAEIGWR